MPLSPQWTGTIATGGSGSSSVTSTATTYTILAKGNLVFCYGSNGNPSGISDTKGNTWIQVPGTSGYTKLWYCIANASGSTTITVTFPASVTFTQVLVTEYTVFSVGQPFDVDLVITYAVGVTSFSQSFVTSIPNELIVVFANSYGSQSAFTTTSGLTLHYNNGSIAGFVTSLYFGDRPAATPGSYTESGTITSAPNGAQFIYLTIRPPDPASFLLQTSNSGMKGQRVFSKVR